MLVRYETPLGVESKSLKYRVEGESALPEAIGAIPLPLLAALLLVPPVAAVAIWLFRTRSGRSRGGGS